MDKKAKEQTVKLIPFHHFSIKTELSPEQIAERLTRVTDLSEGTLWNSVNAQSSKAYLGTVNSHEFRIVRHISYRNSFYPIIYGAIQETDSFTVIDITQKMMGYTQTICLLGLLFCLICCAILWQQPLFIEGVITNKIAPYLFLAFGYGIAEIGFWHEADLSKDELKSLLS